VKLEVKKTVNEGEDGFEFFVVLFAETAFLCVEGNNVVLWKRNKTFFGFSGIHIDCFYWPKDGVLWFAWIVAEKESVVE